MTNILKLKARLIENNLTYDNIAKSLKISKQSLSFKINNKREFKASEINKLTLILKLNYEEMYEIFFAKDVE